MSYGEEKKASSLSGEKKVCLSCLVEQFRGCIPKTGNQQ